jgi:predicted unusual protein kinase regulating ubiquinone biosynthesis (AarF/ABC1/UbiB family)
LVTVIWVVLRRLVVPAVTPGRKESGPVRLRKALTDLGAGFSKLGQVLALRFDLLPPEYCYELFNLLDAVPPFPYEQVEEVLGAELGAPPGRLFAEFERTPFASASIGQVHRAVLWSGEPVAVKVQRPGIRRVLQADITLMYVAASVIDRTRVLGGTRARDVVTEFARWTRQEIDYRIEAEHAQELALNAAGDELEINAHVYTELSAERVLTLEFMTGIPLIEIFRARQRGDDVHLARLRRQGIELERVASHLVWNVLNQIYLFGYFHADLHPANLFVMPGNAIGYVDFGIVGRLEAGLRSSLLLYARDLFRGDISGAIDELMKWIRVSDRTDVAAARSELLDIMEDYLRSLRDSEGGAAREGSSVFELDLLNVVRRNEMSLASGAVMYLKALITVDAVVFELDPDFDLEWHENHFFASYVANTVNEWRDPRRLASSAFDYGIRLNRVFDSLENFRRTGTDVSETITSVRRRMRILGSLCAVGAAVATYFAATALPSRSVAGVVPVEVLLGAVLVLAVLIVFSAGRLPDRRENGELVRGDTLRRRWNRTRLEPRADRMTRMRRQR